MTFRMLATIAAGAIALIAAPAAQAGSPVVGVQVSIERTPPPGAAIIAPGVLRRAGPVQTDAKGAFTIANVPSCNCVVKVWGRALAGKRGPDLVLTVAGKRAALTCEWGTCRTRAISVGGNISGSVRTAR
jgi:hypothetical protein